MTSAAVYSTNRIGVRVTNTAACSIGRKYVIWQLQQSPPDCISQIFYFFVLGQHNLTVSWYRNNSHAYDLINRIPLCKSNRIWTAPPITASPAALIIAHRATLYVLEI